MAVLKTKLNEVTPEDFLSTIENEQVRADCSALIELMQKVSGKSPKMWGTGIIGFGQYHYKYESGHEGDMCMIGISPRKANISVYGLSSAPNNHELLEKLGKHKTGKSCLYINRLKDVNLDVLQELIINAMTFMNLRYAE